MQCACAMSSVAYPTLKHFSTLSHKRYDFRRKGLLGRTAGFRGNFATYRYVWRCGRELRTIPTVQRSTHSATLYPQCKASSCPLVFLCVRVSRACACLFAFIKWCRKYWRWSESTSNNCRGCPTCLRFSSSVDCIVMTVVRTDYFSRTCSATRHSLW